MRTILSARSRQTLARFAASRVLLAFDYDGTLAPITRDRRRARMRLRTRELLRDLCRRYPCVVISGRARADVAAKVRGLGLLAIVGNHGMEPRPNDGRFPAVVRRWRALLDSLPADMPGVVVEDKRLSLSVHYRAVKRKRHVRTAIHEVLRALRSARLIGGKDVVNVVPKDASHKGTALERLRALARCDAAIYVGDDETDEDVFALKSAAPLLGVRVGKSATTAAAYYLKRQQEIDRFLHTMSTLRTAR